MRQIRITPATRRMCIDMVAQAPEGWIFTPPKEPKRTDDQNARLHAMLGDIAKQVEFFGQKRDLETVKRLLVDAFARVKADEGEAIPGHGYTLPSLDGRGVVQLGVQTRSLGKRVTSELIEYLFAWGGENNVRWSERVDIPGWVRDREVAA